MIITSAQKIAGYLLICRIQQRIITTTALHSTESTPVFEAEAYGLLRELRREIVEEMTIGELLMAHDLDNALDLECDEVIAISEKETQ